MSRSCPKCGDPLRKWKYEEIEVDDCPLCGGIWLDRGEVAKVRKLKADEVLRLEAAAVATNPKNDGAQLCPICRHRMEARRYIQSSVQPMSCASGCGLWLGDGELAKLDQECRPNPEAIAVAQMYGGRTEEAAARYGTFAAVASWLNRRKPYYS